MSAVIENSQTTKAEKPSKSNSIWGSVFFRIIWIPGLIRQFFVARAVKSVTKVELDEELRLYAEMFPNGSLHYGYFRDPGIPAEEISFAALDQAQQDYIHKLVSHIEDADSTVLDVGCGMGGISFLLKEKNYKVVALTPDRHQARYIRSVQPDIHLIESDFESFDEEQYQGQLGTVLTAESLQYLDLDVSLPKIRNLLKQDGRWIACDYFRIDSSEESSGHMWDEFCGKLRESGMRIVYREDITENVLPTLKFASLLLQRFVQPAFNFAQAKVHRKAPLLHYILENLFERLNFKLQRSRRTVDSVDFLRSKRYLLLVIEKTG